MARIPPEPDPFFKWDPDGTQAQRRSDTAGLLRGSQSAAATDSRRKVKRWVLRWAWLLSTGVLVFGYLIMVAALAGHLEWLGL